MKCRRRNPAFRGLWTLLAAALLVGIAPVIADDDDGDGTGGVCVGGLNLPGKACVPPEGT